MNNNIKVLYQTDLYYTMGKAFLFVCLIITYFYFFKISGIIDPIKNVVKSISDKASKFTENVKIPKIKLPEVTMPKIKMPEPDLPKPTNSLKITNRPKPTNNLTKNN